MYVLAMAGLGGGALLGGLFALQDLEDATPVAFMGKVGRGSRPQESSPGVQENSAMICGALVGAVAGAAIFRLRETSSIRILPSEWEDEESFSLM